MPIESNDQQVIDHIVHIASQGVKVSDNALDFVATNPEKMKRYFAMGLSHREIAKDIIRNMRD